MFKKICLWLIVIGALNLGFFGIFSFDVIAWICGGAAMVIARIIYTVIGIAALGYIVNCLIDKRHKT